MLKKMLSPLLCLVLFVAFQTVGTAREISFQSLELLPPDTLAVAQIQDVKAFATLLNQTPVGKAFRTKGVAETLSPLLQIPSGWAQFLRVEELKSNDMLSRILEKLPPGGQLCLALLDIRLPVAPEKSELDWIAVWEPRDESNDWERLVLLCADQTFKLPHYYGLSLQRKEMAVAGTKVYEWQHGERSVPFSFTLFENRLVLSNQARHIARLISIRQKDKAGIYNAQPDAEPEILRHHPSFVRMQHALDGADFRLYVNIARLMTHPMNFFGKPHPKGFDWQKLAGSAAIKGAGLSLRATEAGFSEQLFIDIPAGERTGFMACLNAEKMDETLLAGVSAQSTAVFACQMDPQKMFEQLRSSMQSADARIKQSLDLGLTILLEQFHLSPELIFGFDGRVLFTLCGEPGAEPLPLLPGAIIKLGMKNSATTAKALALFKSNMKEHLEFIETPFDKSTLVTIRPKHSDFGISVFQVSYVIQDNFLLLSPYPLALKNELFRIAAPAKHALVMEKTFADCRKNLPGQLQGISFLNTAQVFDSVQALALPYVQTFGGEFAKAAAQWPDRELAALKFPPVLFGMRIEDNGVSIDASGPAPALSVFTLAAAAFALELSEKCRKHFLPSREQIKALQVALEAYAKDHADMYPAKIAELNPKYMPVIPASFRFLEYLGKQDEPNAVVAYEKAPADDLISLLLQTGRITKCKALELPSILKNGYPLDRPENPRNKLVPHHP